MRMMFASGCRSEIFCARASRSFDLPDLRTPVMTLMSGVSASSNISERYAVRSISFTGILLNNVRCVYSPKLNYIPFWGFVYSTIACNDENSVWMAAANA